MAYTITDVDKNEFDGPSINGLRELKAEIVKANSKNFPALSQFLIHGHTKLLLPLRLECDDLASTTKNANVASTLKSISAASKKAKEMLILEA